MNASSDLGQLFSAQAEVRRWKAESENATARLELSRMRESLAFLLSQYEPVNSLGIDRESLRVLLNFVAHGDACRLAKGVTELKGDKP